MLISCGKDSNNGGSDSSSSSSSTEAIAPPALHKAFALNEQQLFMLIAELPEDIQEKILQSSESFLDQCLILLNEPEEFLWLIDKEHALGSDYEPTDLVALKDYPLAVNRSTHQLREILMLDLLAMNQAATDEGLTLLHSSTYRSYATQERVYNHWVNEMGKEEADKVSAQPGKSQHQLGTTIDFGNIEPSFADTPEGQWLYSNAHRFGFSLSYPDGYEELTGYSHEIWHYRYIGKPAAAFEQHYFKGVQQYLMMFWLNAEVKLRDALIQA